MSSAKIKNASENSEAFFYDYNSKIIS